MLCLVLQSQNPGFQTMGSRIRITKTSQQINSKQVELPESNWKELIYSAINSSNFPLNFCYCLDFKAVYKTITTPWSNV